LPDFTERKEKALILNWEKKRVGEGRPSFFCPRVREKEFERRFSGKGREKKEKRWAGKEKLCLFFCRTKGEKGEEPRKREEGGGKGAKGGD